MLFCSLCLFTVVLSERCEEGDLAEREEILSEGRRGGDFYSWFTFFLGF